MAVKYKIRKGDPVIVVAGRDRGKKGSVLVMLPKEGRAIVQGVNVAKTGDIVRIQECRPVSKTKTWTLLDRVTAEA